MQESKSPLLAKKIGLIILILHVLFFALTARLLYLQWYLNQDLFNASKKNFLRTEYIPCPRGNIIDCNGELLATNRPVSSIYWQGTGNKKLTQEQLDVLHKLELLVEKELVTQPILERLIRTEKSSTSMPLIIDVSLNALSQVLEQFPNHPNIFVKTDFKRFYPNNKIACHLLGHIANMNLETIGKMGLEKIVQDDLKGERGILLKKINSLGTNLHVDEVKAALGGQTIKTTLDLSLQQIAEGLFPEEYAGCLIIMDPSNGAIKTLISRPNFDPTVFLDPIATPEWQAMQEGRPFLNRALESCYPPASIFKLVTICAGIEQRIVSPDDSHYCSGYVKFRGRRYHCKKHEGHGLLTLQESVAKSCNTIFFKIGMRLSIDTLADYAFRFGFGKKTGILFPEKEGLVPTSAWKKEARKEPWWPGETLSASIGQSFLLTTPIQIACMISSIYQGYRVQPRILEDEPVITYPLNIATSTRKFIKKSMKSVVQFGSGMNVSKIRDIKVYAKTGTAQTMGLNHNPEANPQALEHVYFVCTFQYKKHTPLTMVIFMEHAGSSSVPTGIAKKILMAYRAHMRKLEAED